MKTPEGQPVESYEASQHMEKEIVHTLELECNPSGDYVSPHDQLSKYVKDEIARGAEFIDMGRSSIGSGLRFTDEERDVLLDGLDGAFQRVKERANLGIGLDELSSLKVEDKEA